MPMFRPDQMQERCPTCKGKRGLKCDLCSGRGIVMTRMGQQIVKLIKSEFFWPWLEAKVASATHSAIYNYNLKAGGGNKVKAERVIKDLKQIEKKLEVKVT